MLKWCGQRRDSEEAGGSEGEVGGGVRDGQIGRQTVKHIFLSFLPSLMSHSHSNPVCLSQTETDRVCHLFSHVSLSLYPSISVSVYLEALGDDAPPPPATCRIDFPAAPRVRALEPPEPERR